MRGSRCCSSRVIARRPGRIRWRTMRTASGSSAPTATTPASRWSASGVAATRYPARARNSSSEANDRSVRCHERTRSRTSGRRARCAHSRSRRADRLRRGAAPVETAETVVSVVMPATMRVGPHRRTHRRTHRHQPPRVTCSPALAVGSPRLVNAGSAFGQDQAAAAPVTSQRSWRNRANSGPRRASIRTQSVPISHPAPRSRASTATEAAPKAANAPTIAQARNR